MKGQRSKEAGQATVEHVLILPLAVAMIAAVIGIALMGTRGVVARLAVSRAAGLMALFREDLAAAELHASLHPSIFAAHAYGVTDSSGGPRFSTEVEGMIEAAASPSPVLNAGAASVPWLIRRERIVPALPPGLGDAALRGGDTPSPYCRTEGGYSECGYP